MRALYEIKQIELSSYGDGKADIFVSEKYLTTDFELHCHNHFEAEFVFDGSAIENINGKTVEIKRGSLYVLKPSDYHSVKINSPLSLITLSFDYRMLPKSLLEYFCDETQDYIFQVAEEYPVYKVLFEILLVEQYKSPTITLNVLAVIFEKLARLSGVRDKSVSDAINPVSDAMAYTNLCFGDNPSVKDVARIAGYTPEYFSFLFKKKTGQSYTEYLTSVKIANAKKMLKINGLAVSEICFACGFGSVSNFNRVFKKTEGISPSQYRKNHS